MRSLIALLMISQLVAAQSPPVRLAEEAAAGTLTNTTIELKLAGKMKLDRNGTVEAIPLEATGKHVYRERSEEKSTGRRLYSEASSTTVAGIERGTRSLAKDRSNIVINRKGTSIQPWSPAGALTHDDLSLVAEHFDTLSLPGLLPNKAVAFNDTWAISDDTVAAVCAFDGVIQHSLTGKLISSDVTSATLAIEGTAEGIEHGAKVKLTITAKGTFDFASKRITHLTWEQADDREAGPISPAMEAKVTVTITRRAATDSPAEFAATLPDKADAALLAVHYMPANAAFELNYDRDWHPVVQSDTHLVLRRVVKSELIAQATITTWKKVADGVTAAANLKEFLDATRKQPGWEPDRVLVDGAVKTGGNQSVFRHVVSGKQDGMAVVQSFLLVTHDNGKQVILSCVSRPEMVEKHGTGDAALAEAIRIPAK